MAYPTGMLSFVLENIDREMAGIKLTCQQVKAESIAGSIPSSRIWTLFINLRQSRQELVAAGSTPGIAEFARAQKNMPALDVVAEFTSVLAALDGVTAWVGTNFPKVTDGNGTWLLAQSLGADSPVDRMFTTAQLATFRTVLDGLIATIA